MSSILDYLKSLLPVYEKRDLQATLADLQQEHTETVMPVVQNIRELFTNYSFKSELYKRYTYSLHKYVTFNQAPITLLLDSLERIQGNFPFLEAEVKKAFSNQIATTNLTYDSVHLLRYIDSISFYIRYARRFLLLLVGEEVVPMGGTRPEWTRGELDYVNENLENFAGLLPAMLKTEVELKRTFEAVSNAEVNEGTVETAARTLGANGIDPMRLNAFTPQRNWILSIGKALVEWRVKRYKAAKEELTALQLRLQEYRELAEGGDASPQLQKLIKNLEQRVAELDYEVREVEDANKY